MNENVRIHHGSSLERQIASAPMTESDRQNALAALEIAEAMVDGCAWVARKFAELVDLLLLKPGVKH